ncbi:MAG: ferrochelatase [Bdellovibrionota bacterium]
MTVKTGVLISNLGSPDAPTPEALRSYLDQFLMDPFVIDLPYLLRAFVVRGLILRKRAAASAKAYEIIWTPEGSPLVVNTKNLTRKVQAALGADYSVKFAMRYANPSFKNVLDEFLAEGIQEVLLLPLYPQWALASSASTDAHVRDLKHPCRVKAVLKPFYAHNDFIELFATRVKETQEKFSNSKLKTHYLFSFHGIPERHIRKSPGCSKCPIDSECCLKESAPEFCYRSHCTHTTHSLAATLGLKTEEYSMSFQSRLGVDQWLLPFTDVVLKELPKKGVERLVMLSPAFTSDCLETIEELGERGQHDFIEAGGKEFHLVSSLNDRDDWADVLAKWVKTPQCFQILIIRWRLCNNFVSVLACRHRISSRKAANN